MNDEEIKARLMRLPTAILSDASGTFRVMSHEIKPIFEGVKMVGKAHTINLPPGDLLSLQKGLMDAAAGEVFVLSCGGYPGVAIIGELIAMECKIKGISGFVLDGGVRDIAGLREIGIPVFTKGVTPRVGALDSIGEFGVDCTCGGVNVSPGDWVIGDDDGVVVLRNDNTLREVIETAEKIHEREREIMELIKGGSTLAEVFDLKDMIDEKIKEKKPTMIK